LFREFSQYTEVGGKSVVMGLDAIGWAYSQLSRGMNETRGKQRIVNTIMPAVELPEERKKEGVAKDGSVWCRPPIYWWA
jgi:hypothetical protein